MLAELRPARFVLENVYALTFANRASTRARDALLAGIRDAGYRHRMGVLHAADYGVPQARPRLFIVGAPSGEPLPLLPAPTHGGAWESRATGNPARPHVGAGEALAGLAAEPEPGEAVDGKWGHLLPGIPPGGNYLHYTAERGCPEPLFAWRSRYWSFLLKLDPARPSPVIQAQPGPYTGPFHWENRRLRVAEIRRLFGFPDDFTLAGSRRSVQAQLGNSVPPPLAEQVIRALTQEKP
jgi:DNA (cytosine-5)-methyltransferase 1